MLTVHGSYVNPDDDVMRELARPARPVEPRLAEQLRQPRGGLVQVEAAEWDNLVRILARGEIEMFLGPGNVARVKFAMALAELERAGFIRMPRRGPERVVLENGNQLAPLRPNKIVDLLRRNRDDLLFRHYERLPLHNAEVHWVNLHDAVTLISEGARQTAIEFLNWLPETAHEFLDWLPETKTKAIFDALDGKADWARVRGGSGFHQRLKFRLKQLLQGVAVAALQVEELLGLMFFGHEYLIMDEAAELAKIAPLQLEKLFQALDEAVRIAAADSASDATNEIVQGMTQINVDDEAAQRFAQRIARRVSWRRTRYHTKLPPAEHLRILRQDRMDIINQNPEFSDKEELGEYRLVDDIVRRVRHTEPLVALQPMELVIVIRWDLRDVFEDHAKQLYDHFDPDLLQNRLHEASLLAIMASEGNPEACEAVDTGIAELIARLERQVRPEADGGGNS